jgi:hypothetical protein
MSATASGTAAPAANRGAAAAASNMAFAAEQKRRSLWR